MRKLILLIFTLFLLIPSGSLVATPTGSGPSVDPPPEIIENLEADDVVRIIVNVRNWFAGIVLIIAVAVVLFAGFLYMTAGGDDKKVETAKKTLLNGIIGIVVALFAYGIVTLISNLIKDFGEL